MKYYLTAALTIHEDSWLKEYTPNVGALVEKHGGVFLARTHELEKMEGDGDAPEVCVIIEFPSKEAAQGFYHDSDYKPYLDSRKAGATGDLMLIAGEDMVAKKS